MGRDQPQHVGRGQEPAGAAPQGRDLYRQSSALWAVHGAGSGGVVKQLRQRSDGLQPEQAGVGWPCRLRSCAPVSRGRHQGSLGEADR